MSRNPNPTGPAFPPPGPPGVQVQPVQPGYFGYQPQQSMSMDQYINYNYGYGGGQFYPPVPQHPPYPFYPQVPPPPLPSQKDSRVNSLPPVPPPPPPPPPLPPANEKPIRPPLPPDPSGYIVKPKQSYPPLLPPPLPPTFPWLSPELLSEPTGQKRASATPPPPIHQNKWDMKMSENEKSILFYEDIIDQSLPKLLRNKFQPLYCGLCELNLSSVIVARDHYKGKKHARNIEVWLEENNLLPSNPTRENSQFDSRDSRDSRPNPGFNEGEIKGNFPRIQGTVTRLNGPSIPNPAQQNQRFNNQSQFNNFPNDNFPRPPFNRPFNPSFDNGFPNTNNRPSDFNSHPNNEFRPGQPLMQGNDNNFRMNNSNQQMNSGQYEVERISRKRIQSDSFNDFNGSKKPKQEGSFCQLCQCPLNSKQSEEQHYKGKNHKLRLEGIDPATVRRDAKPPLGKDESKLDDKMRDRDGPRFDSAERISRIPQASPMNPPLSASRLPPPLQPVNQFMPKIPSHMQPNPPTFNPLGNNPPRGHEPPHSKGNKLSDLDKILNKIEDLKNMDKE